MVKLKVHKVVIFRNFWALDTQQTMLPSAIDLALSILYLSVHFEECVVILSVIFIIIFSIFFTLVENSLMASTIVEELASNFLFPFLILLLALSCTPNNLQALVLGVSEPTNGA
jgi:hypothetical protein